MEDASRPDNRLRWRPKPDIRIRWIVKCTDALGRDAEVWVGIDGTKVVTVFPAPAEGVVMTAEQNRQLTAAYAAADVFLTAVGSAQEAPP